MFVKYPVLEKNDILGSRLIACCKLAPTLARQIWRHNYVIGRNEYLISTLSESRFPWVYSLQFLFKSTHQSWRYERKCEWVFFSEHSVQESSTTDKHYCNQAWLCNMWNVQGREQVAGQCSSNMVTKTPRNIHYGTFSKTMSHWLNSHLCHKMPQQTSS